MMDRLACVAQALSIAELGAKFAQKTGFNLKPNQKQWSSHHLSGQPSLEEPEQPTLIMQHLDILSKTKANPLLIYVQL
jgi:hypothetical protein